MADKSWSWETVYGQHRIKFLGERLMSLNKLADEARASVFVALNEVVVEWEVSNVSDRLRLSGSQELDCGGD